MFWGPLWAAPGHLQKAPIRAQPALIPIWNDPIPHSYFAPIYYYYYNNKFIFSLFVREGRPAEPLKNLLPQWHEASFYCLLFIFCPFNIKILWIYSDKVSSIFLSHGNIHNTSCQFISIINNWSPYEIPHLTSITHISSIPTRDSHHLIRKPILKFSVINYIKYLHTGCHLTSTSCIN